MKQPTFKDDGKRRIVCGTCGHYMGDTYLGEKKTRNLRCSQCQTISIICPPLKDNNDGVKVIKFGAEQGMFTADLTGGEIEDSL